jgi:hypothetical protein
MAPMPNPGTDDDQDQLRSPACIHQTHEECPHLHGYGGGLNLRRLRFEASAMLCKCECHSSCLITGKRTTVPEQTWRESCTCPGAEDERLRRERTRA